MSQQIIEIPAILASIFNLYLIARASIWNWLFGAIAVILYFIIFLTAKLYADAGLQLFYLAVQFYGFYSWRKQYAHAIPISTMPTYMYGVAIPACIMLDVAFMYFLKHYTDSNTVILDALNTSICLIAQWMMIRRWLQNWWWWAVANVVAIDMYLTKSLYYTCGLYIIFLVFAVYGYLHWKKLMTSACCQDGYKKR